MVIQTWHLLLEEDKPVVLITRFIGSAISMQYRVFRFYLNANLKCLNAT